MHVLRRRRPTRLFLVCCLRGAQHLLRANERRVLGSVASRAMEAVARRAAWFDGHSQPLPSSASNTMDEDVATWPGAKTYVYSSSALAFPDVTRRRARLGQRQVLLRGRVASSAGQHDRRPFRRPVQPARAGKRGVAARDRGGGRRRRCALRVDRQRGADVERPARALCARAAGAEARGPRRHAYFFVWAGDWPLRGIGRETVDVARGAY